MFKIILLVVILVSVGHVVYNRLVYPYLVDKSMEPYIKMEEGENNDSTKS